MWIVKWKKNGGNPIKDKDIHQKSSLRMIGVQNVRRIGKWDNEK